MQVIYSALCLPDLKYHKASVHFTEHIQLVLIPGLKLLPGLTNIWFTLIHNCFSFHKFDRLQIDIFNTENPQNGLGKLGLSTTTIAPSSGAYAVKWEALFYPLTAALCLINIFWNYSTISNSYILIPSQIVNIFNHSLHQN